MSIENRVVPGHLVPRSVLDAFKSMGPGVELAVATPLLDPQETSVHHQVRWERVMIVVLGCKSKMVWVLRSWTAGSKLAYDLTCGITENLTESEHQLGDIFSLVERRELRLSPCFAVAPSGVVSPSDHSSDAGKEMMRLLKAQHPHHDEGWSMPNETVGALAVFLICLVVLP